MKCSKQVVATTVAAIIALGSAPLAMAGEYVVKKGDCLSTIAPKYNTTWQVLAQMNQLKNPNLIFPNQILQTPEVEKVTVPAEVIKPATPVEEKEAEVSVVSPAPVEEAVKAELTSLTVDDITLKGNGIAPEFSANVTEYTMNVQSDIYGVKVTPVAVDGATITVNGEEAVSGEGKVVKLVDTYEFYGVDYSLPIEIVVTNADVTKTYTVTVVRENDADTYALFEEKTYEDSETGVTMPYEIYVPTNYDATKKYPVVFALHGSGQRAQTTDMILKRYKMATIWAQDSEAGVNECIVIAPHCSTSDANENWTTLMQYRNGLADNSFDMTKYSVAAYNLLQNAIKEYSVDTNKVYMTGLSAGGFATYAIAIAHPETFAAIVPDAAGADPTKVEALKGIPMWIFHASDDPTVAPEEYLYPTLEALDAADVKYKTTIYDAGEVFTPSAHFSWTACYADETMRNWLFEQSK